MSKDNGITDLGARIQRKAEEDRARRAAEKMGKAMEQAVELAINAARYSIVRAQHPNPEALDMEIDKIIVQQREKEEKAALQQPSTPPTDGSTDPKLS